MAKKSARKQKETLFKEKLVPAKAGSGELFEVSYETTKPVECLGMTFENEAARREYFLDLLRVKLTDPEFRKIEGFPVGEDEDILAISDPPYYTACPNPFMLDLIAYSGRSVARADYDCKPFASDVSHGKSDPVYTAHSYHTKVPHQAIMRFILHYTKPGDVVLDGFCGTGMTGVAAQLCEEPPEDLRKELESEMPELEWGARFPVLCDLSPFATFIASNYNTPVDVTAFAEEFEASINDVEDLLSEVYRFTPQGASGSISLTVWSDVFTCPNCGGDIIYWENGIKRQVGKIEPMPCPHCGVAVNKSSATHKMSSFYDPFLRKTVQQPTQVPVLVRGPDSERIPGEADQSVNDRCLALAAELEIPIAKMMYRDEPWGDIYRAGYHAGVTHVHHFYTPRQLLAMATLAKRFRESPLGRRLLLVLTSFAIRNGFKGNRFVINGHNPNGRINGPLTNCLYFPSLLAEQNIIDLARSKAIDILNAFKTVSRFRGKYCLTTESASGLKRLPDNSIDYVFIDPPFGANIMYSEMNFLVESWLKCVTNNTSEAIVNETQGKDEEDYRSLMTKCLDQFFRVLKPGRWLTMEFHNSRNSIWNAIQTAMGEAGFVIADVRILDKKKGTVYQEYYVSGATKKDLVISAYKPSESFETRFRLEAGTETGVWDFVESHLRQLPVFVGKDDKAESLAERQQYLLFDRMIAFHVQRRVAVPISAAEFHAGLAERYAERDSMFFLADQVVEYDKKRMTVSECKQLEFFVSDEASAIQWLKQVLRGKPQPFQELQPQFMQQVSGWQPNEKSLELSELLEQNFLCYDERDDVPSQIHRYLSSNFHDLRNLEKDDSKLKVKAKDRWYVPDPRKEIDLEKVRHRALMREFNEYRQQKGKLTTVRKEALRAGFKECWRTNDYATIMEISARVREELIQEDTALLMYYDNAAMLTGE